MAQLQKWSSAAERQRAFRQRRDERVVEGSKAVDRLRRLDAAIKIAVRNGSLPAGIDKVSQFGDSIDNLIEYLSKQQSLFKQS